MEKISLIYKNARNVKNAEMKNMKKKGKKINSNNGKSFLLFGFQTFKIIYKKFLMKRKL